MKVQTQDTYAAVLVAVVVGGTEANVGTPQGHSLRITT